MSKTILSISLLFFCSITIAQINFEKGYFIDNTGKKIECLIKNGDWKDNPESFEYKLSENSDIRMGTVKNIREFSVNGQPKYVSGQVKIDRSSNNPNALDYEQQPVFNEEDLFLKVLVEGEADLFVYSENNLERFFFRNGDGGIIQLVYKLYLKSPTEIGKNMYYRQQLFNNLKCGDSSYKSFEKMRYNRNNMVKTFNTFNSCANPDFVVKKEEKKKTAFHLTLRPGMTSNSLTVADNLREQRYSFDAKTGLRLGMELEIVLPFNKNKWAVLIEPTYQSYDSESSTTVEGNYFIPTRTYISTATYKSMELPVGFRYYSFLSESSKIFFDLLFIADFPMDSSIQIDDNTPMEIETNENLAVGIGYGFKNKLNLELRYHSPRGVLGDYVLWGSDFAALNLILGYTLF